MERRELGGSGIAVSRVILGCGNFGGVGSAPAFFGQGESEEEAFAIMDAAWELGVRTFDTADAYGGGRSETWIGRWLTARGHRPVLATKVFNSVVGDPQDRGLAPERIRRQIEGSLDRLVLPARPGAGTGFPAFLRRTRARLHALQPARRGLADWKVRAGDVVSGRLAHDAASGALYRL